MQEKNIEDIIAEILGLPKKDLIYSLNIVLEFLKGTDRSAAILLGAELDNLLLKILKKHFIPKKRTTTNDIDLFAPSGPLGGFAARIEIAFRIGLINEIVFHDLHLLRRIRNRFAHGTHGITFNSQSINDLVVNFRSITKDEEHFLTLDLTKPRIHFQSVAALILGYLMHLERKIKPLKTKKY
ncbi:hypothetical protein KAW55_07095 [bacterium]|nr:hypothetical protein [bacterium]